MNKTQNNTPNGNAVPNSKAVKAIIELLIADLLSKDGTYECTPAAYGSRSKERHSEIAQNDGLLSDQIESGR